MGARTSPSAQNHWARNVRPCRRSRPRGHLCQDGCFQCRTGNAHVCKNYRILGIDLDGSYAEHVRLPERVLWKTSPEIPPELACLQEPLGNAVHAALVEEITGQSVLITGCGPTGLFAAAVARTAGAGLIIATDGSDYRLALAKRVGVDAAVKAGAGEAETRKSGGHPERISLGEERRAGLALWDCRRATVLRHE